MTTATRRVIPSQTGNVRRSEGVEVQRLINKGGPAVKSGRNPATLTVLCMRLLLLAAGLLVYVTYDTLQRWTDRTWGCLRATWVYNCVYFETWWATVCYGAIIGGPYAITKLGVFHQYKLDPALEWQSAGLRTILLEAVEYCTPLMLLDTVLVKRYHNVDPTEWDARAARYVQYTRALPVAPPTVGQVLLQLAVSFVLYDLMFFAVHYALHHNVWLYRSVHAEHHKHGLVHSRITNQLTVTERIVLVLSANQALKFVSAHPLTRTLFVPLFIGMLVENHYGYDLPFTLDKVVPFGLFGGAAHHFKHHTVGSRNYQPFFTYVDRLLESYGNWKRKINNNKLIMQ